MEAASESHDSQGPQDQQAPQTPMPPAPLDATAYIRVLGLAAGMFSLLHVLIAGSAAVSARPAIIALQRSLIDYSQGGGVSIDTLGDPLIRLFLVTYLSALVAFCITLVFCWYAGRVAVEHRNRPYTATRAGVQVAVISGLVWLVIGIPAILLTHADGTISWLVATIGVILISPKAPPLSSVYMTSPDGLFLLIELIVLLIQVLPFLLIAIGVGALAGRIGGNANHA